jgi:hypothetical protein
MKRINFDVEESLHRTIKAKALAEGVTMRALILGILGYFFNERGDSKEGEEVLGGKRMDKLLQSSSSNTREDG